MRSELFETVGQTNAGIFVDLLGIPYQGENGEMVFPPDANAPEKRRARFAIQSVEYNGEILLPAGRESDFVELRTRKNWDFIGTGLAAAWYPSGRPFFEVVHVDYSNGRYSSKFPGAQPPENPVYAGQMSAQAEAGPGALSASMLLSPFGDRFHAFGQNAIIRVKVTRPAGLVGDFRFWYSIIGWEVAGGYDGR